MTLPLSSGDDPRHLRAIEHRQVLGLLRFGNGGEAGGILGPDLASAAIAIAVIRASRPPAIRLRIDRRGRVKRLPAERQRGLVHVIQIIASAQRRHRIFALPRTFVNVARRIQLALNVARLARNAHFVLHDVVVRLQLVVTDGPILERRSFRKQTRAVAFDRFRARLEIPRLQPPALRMIVNRRAADRVHHRMRGRLPRLGIRTGAKRRDFLLGLGNGGHQRRVRCCESRPA